METALTNDDILALIDRAGEAGEDIYDTAVNAGVVAAGDHDKNRWLIGDLASRIKKRYGQDMIGRFATDINMEKSRVKDYRRVCEFWEKDTRASILATMPVITFSHMRLAMRLGNHPEALSFLEECADNAWTVEQAMLELNKRQGKAEPPVKLLEITTLRYEVNLNLRTVTVHLPAHHDLTELKKRNDAREPVRLVITEDK